MQNMYPGKVNSPQTELASAITDTDTTIPLLDASVLPDPPNLATIGTGEDAETILYTGVSGNDLTGVTRGFQGAAKAWAQGTKVARNFTAYDYDALRQNVADHVAATTSVHGATNAASPNTIVQRDPAGRFKAAAPVEADDVARKKEVDGKVSKSGDTMTGLLTALGGIDLEVPSVPTGKVGRMHANGANGQLYYHDFTGWHHVWTGGNLPYETGTWTPELRFGGSTEGITYAFRGGQYTRIANVVYWTLEIVLSSIGSAEGIATITGLPFSKAPGLVGHGFDHSIARTVNIDARSGYWLVSYIVDTTVHLTTDIGTAISAEWFSNNSELRASGFYFI